LSEFNAKQDANSIETCLVNVDSCDEVIVILNQRYGPRLGKVGFEDVSATHLEYRRAVERQKPMHVFVRDRLDAELTSCERHRRKQETQLALVGTGDLGLFELLEEHRQLHATSGRSNWFYPFTSSVDLRAAISKYFGRRLLPTRLVQAINENRFP